MTDERFNELVEQLKNNKKDFGLCESEEREVFRKVKWQNCLEHCSAGWIHCREDFYGWWTYRIKSDYKPEPEKPEFIKVEIKIHDGFLSIERPKEIKLFPAYDFINLHSLPSLPNFDHFETPDKAWRALCGRLAIENVSQAINEGNTVYAIFRR